jgi:hypothetical protein
MVGVRRDVSCFESRFVFCASNYAPPVALKQCSAERGLAAPGCDAAEDVLPLGLLGFFWRDCGFFIMDESQVSVTPVVTEDASCVLFVVLVPPRRKCAGQTGYARFREIAPLAYVIRDFSVQTVYPGTVCLERAVPDAAAIIELLEVIFEACFVMGIEHRVPRVAVPQKASNSFF